MHFELGQKIIDKVRGKKQELKTSCSQCTINKEYGNIYFPFYNTTGKIVDFVPEIYNKNGEKMDIFFIRDSHSAHDPYMFGSKYFLWDRFNIGLETHFYTHMAMLEAMGQPKRKYGWLLESRTIVPDDYEIFNHYKGLEKDFDAIFTFDEKILDTISNAKFFTACADVTYGKGQDTAKMTDKQYEAKTKNVSMVCSDKNFTQYHKIRQAFAKNALNAGVDVYGKFNNRPIKYKSESLEKYRYQIVVENGVYDYYFTEKILDCFVSMTIPIYLGARKIGNFFNPEGIIKISKNDIDNLENILKQCNKKDYEQKIHAIIDNYKKSLQYTNMMDMLYEQYFKR